MKLILMLSLFLLLPAATLRAQESGANPRVVLETSKGTIELELDAAKAPQTVENFLGYVESGFYANTVFHRVIDGFMIQGGGFTEAMEKKATREPIQNEADNGLSNSRGTIAMARTNDPHSATAQFFINTVDNPYLNHRSKDAQGWGYTVFGKVVEGMDVVDAIAKAKTGQKMGMANVPTEAIVIESVKVKGGGQE